MKFTELRAALAAAPVAGPWNSAEYTDHDGPPACDDIAVQAQAKPHELETLLTMDWSERPPRGAGFTREQATATARFIAAASPDVVLALLAELDRLRTPLDYDAAHAVFEGWYHDDESGVEFVRRVEAAHGIGGA